MLANEQSIAFLTSASYEGCVFGYKFIQTDSFEFASLVTLIATCLSAGQTQQAASEQLSVQKFNMHDSQYNR